MTWKEFKEIVDKKLAEKNIGEDIKLYLLEVFSPKSEKDIHIYHVDDYVEIVD